MADSRKHAIKDPSTLSFRGAGGDEELRNVANFRARFLALLGMTRIESVFQQTARRYPFWLGCVVLAMLSATACRNDMHQQPKYVPLEESSFFADGRSARPMVAGTIPHGELRTDELRYTGKINGVTADQFPFPITRQDLERGRQRFNVNCSPCHDYTGSGHGVVVQRGLLQPPSYHSEKLRKVPVGHFFEVITNGYGQMYSYSSRVTPDDRWRIAAYIRALQLSQNATLNDVPEDQRQSLQKGQ